MKKAENIEVEVYSNSNIPEALNAALDGIKSFSPGEVYEFLQSKFPLCELKSKAHHKTAAKLGETLEGVLDQGSLNKSDASQVRLYLKSLSTFVEAFEAEQEEENEEATPAPRKKGFADEFLSNLKSVAEAEKKRFLELAAKKKKGEAEVIEATYRKVKKSR